MSFQPGEGLFDIAACSDIAKNISKQQQRVQNADGSNSKRNRVATKNGNFDVAVNNQGKSHVNIYNQIPKAYPPTAQGAAQAAYQFQDSQNKKNRRSVSYNKTFEGQYQDRHSRRIMKIDQKHQPQTIMMIQMQQNANQSSPPSQLSVIPDNPKFTDKKIKQTVLPQVISSTDIRQQKGSIYIEGLMETPSGRNQNRNKQLDVMRKGDTNQKITELAESVPPSKSALQDFNTLNKSGYELGAKSNLNITGGQVAQNTIITEISARVETQTESIGELPNIHRNSANLNNIYPTERIPGTASDESRQPSSPAPLIWNSQASQNVEQYRIKPIKKRKIGSRSSNRAAPTRKNLTAKGSGLTSSVKPSSKNMPTSPTLIKIDINENSTEVDQKTFGDQIDQLQHASTNSTYQKAAEIKDEGKYAIKNRVSLAQMNSRQPEPLKNDHRLSMHEKKRLQAEQNRRKSDINHALRLSQDYGLGMQGIKQLTAPLTKNLKIIKRQQQTYLTQQLEQAQALTASVHTIDSKIETKGSRNNGKSLNSRKSENKKVSQCTKRNEGVEVKQKQKQVQQITASQYVLKKENTEQFSSPQTTFMTKKTYPQQKQAYMNSDGSRSHNLNSPAAYQEQHEIELLKQAKQQVQQISRAWKNQNKLAVNQVSLNVTATSNKSVFRDLQQKALEKQNSNNPKLDFSLKVVQPQHRKDNSVDGQMYYPSNFSLAERSTMFNIRTQQNESRQRSSPSTPNNKVKRATPDKLILKHTLSPSVNANHAPVSPADTASQWSNNVAMSKTQKANQQLLEQTHQIMQHSQQTHSTQVQKLLSRGSQRSKGTTEAYQKIQSVIKQNAEKNHIMKMIENANLASITSNGQTPTNTTEICQTVFPKKVGDMRNAQSHNKSKNKFQPGYQTAVQPKSIPFGNNKYSTRGMALESKQLVNQGPLIQIYVAEDKIHIQHPVNKTIRLINHFIIEAFIKNQVTKDDHSVANINTTLVNQLARQLAIPLPKNNDFKSKNFLKLSKEMMQTKLFQALNKSNDVDLDFKREKFQHYKGFIGRGNNSALFFQLFKASRWWWQLYTSLPKEGSNDAESKEIQSYQSSSNIHGYKLEASSPNVWEDFKEHNFIWTQWKKMRHFTYLRAPIKHDQKQGEAKKESANPSNDWRIYAKMEANHHLSNKFALFYNMNNYYKSIGKDPFDVLPLTFHIGKGTYDPSFFKFQQIFKDEETRIQKIIEENNTKRSDSTLTKKSEPSESILMMRNQQRSISSVKKQTPLKHKFKHTNTSDHGSPVQVNPKVSLISQQQDSESPTRTFQNNSVIKGPKDKIVIDLNSAQSTRQLVERNPKNMQEKGEHEVTKVKKKDLPKNIWIVKPGENTNRGVGISVSSNLKEIRQIITESDYDRSRTFILQKYIDKPALYRGRKFDIRCFAMETLTNKKLKGYIYDEGYLRTSSKTFVCKHYDNKYIHLCNDAVQKLSPDYGRYETANKLSFGDYQSYLDETHSDLKIDFRKHIFSQIKQIMTDTFRATQKVIAPSRDLNHHTFEIYGFDFMLDENFKVYLIEVNTNPCLETTACPLLQRLITDMIDSGLRMALDPLYPPPNMSKRIPLTPPQINQWQLTFDEEIDGPIMSHIQEQVQLQQKQELEEKKQLSNENNKQLQSETPIQLELVLPEDDEQEFI